MNEQDKKIKQLLKGNFDETTLPSDFTHHVMQKIVVQKVMEEQPAFEYEPVISKRAWMVIIVSFFVLIYLGLIGDRGTKFNLSDYAMDSLPDTSLFYSEYTLFAVLSMLALLVIDRLFRRSSLG